MAHSSPVADSGVDTVSEKFLHVEARSEVRDRCRKGSSRPSGEAGENIQYVHPVHTNLKVGMYSR